MTEEPHIATLATHEVFNQSPPFEDINLYSLDTPLIEAVAREGGGDTHKTAAPEGLALDALGARLGSAEMLELGRLANTYPPVLRSFEPRGRRIDRVDYHPAYHAFMALAFEARAHCGSWRVGADKSVGPLPGANVARAAALYMLAQAEAGHCCPITMTNAAVPTLLAQPDVAAPWLAKIFVGEYDPRFLPMAEKKSVTIGMAMTEKQGGTDVRANTTRAEPVGNGGPGGRYRLVGHKWFMSAPMCDAFLVLAQAPGGLSCFLMPRFCEDGTLNAIRLQRLKDKLGNRSNASSEIELEGAEAWLIGEEGRGVPTIIEMVTHTRLDCAISSAGLMRFCLAQAVHHARHRAVFGKRLVEQPLMARVLADMALDVEAAVALSFRLARAFDHPNDEREAAWRRVMTPVTKYWVTKLAPALAYEAMECLGGNGYVEEWPLARIYRELPVNAIWEGSGNVMCLDILRVLKRESAAVELVFEWLEAECADDAKLARALEEVRALLHRPREIESHARAFVEGLARLAAGALLNAHAPLSVAVPFIASRLTGGWRHTYGAGSERLDTSAILERVLAAADTAGKRAEAPPGA